MNLTLEFPRSPNEKLAGLAHVPRMIDKARAARENTLGEYIYPCPLDEMILEFVGADSAGFSEIANSENDEGVAAWLKEKCQHHDAESLKKINETLLNKGPGDPEAWEKFNKMRDSINPSRTDIITWVALIDLEEERC